eukprot:2852569-Rhodomonas_salina.1
MVKRLHKSHTAEVKSQIEEMGRSLRSPGGDEGRDNNGPRRIVQSAMCCDTRMRLAERNVITQRMVVPGCRWGVRLAMMVVLIFVSFLPQHFAANGQDRTHIPCMVDVLQVMQQCPIAARACAWN